MTQNETESADFARQIKMSNPPRTDREDELLRKAVLHLNGHILGFIFGIVAALVIFAATNWLVFKGGEVVGPHLGLLAQFFIGYSVTFWGSFIGAIYGFVCGYLSGLIIGFVYNAIVFLKNR